MMRARALARCLLVALVPVIAGCTDAESPAAVQEPVNLVWPDAPLTPRIKFVRAVSTPQDFGVETGWFDKVVDFLKGADPRRTTQPYGLHRDQEGRLYVVDAFHKSVQVFNTLKSDHYWFPSDPPEKFLNPVGVVSDGKGRVYVSDSKSNVVHVFADHGARYVTAFGMDVLGRPTGMAINRATGDLFVVDTLNGQIVVFDTKTLQSKAFIGKQGDDTEGFHSPTSVAFAPDGRIYVSDSLNFRVQVLDAGFKFLNRFGSAGDAPGYFSRPKGVAVDSDGNVYVVDALFDNVQIFDAEGRLLLAFGKPGSKPGEFWLPTEIFIDSDDRIYVSDSHNQRIQVFQYLKGGKG